MSSPDPFTPITPNRVNNRNNIEDPKPIPNPSAQEADKSHRFRKMMNKENPKKSDKIYDDDDTDIDLTIDEIGQNENEAPSLFDLSKQKGKNNLTKTPARNQFLQDPDPADILLTHEAVTDPNANIKGMANQKTINKSHHPSTKQSLLSTNPNKLGKEPLLTTDMTSEESTLDANIDPDYLMAQNSPPSKKIASFYDQSPSLLEQEDTFTMQPDMTEEMSSNQIYNQQQNPSLFVKNSPPTPTKDPLLMADEEALQKTLFIQENKKTISENTVVNNDKVASSKKQTTIKQTRASADDAQEQIDMAAIDPRNPTAAFNQVGNFSNNNPSIRDEQVARSTTLQEIATQVIDQIQILRRDGQTETTVTLRHPPILQGAQLTITGNEHAQNEFNIAFSSLTNEAKLFLDRKLNEDSLSQTLERKGIIVHMLVTTTAVENPLNVENNEFYGRDQQRESREERRQSGNSFDEEQT